MNITLEISTWGSVFDARIYLEGYEIKLWQTNTARRIKFRHLPDYYVDGGSLDVALETDGKNGSSATLTIKFDDFVDTFTCTNNHGQGVVRRSYPVNSH